MVRELREQANAVKRTKRSLQESEEKYRSLFEDAIDAIFLVDASQNYVDVNKKAVELTGYTREELLRMNILDLVPQEQKPRSREEFDKLKREGRYEKFRGKIRTRSGQLRDIEVSSSAIVEDGRHVGSRDIVRDITDQVKAEKCLRESEEKFRNIFDVANDGILILKNSTRRFVEANQAICSMLGYSRDEIMQLGARDIHPEKDLPKAMTTLELQMRGEKAVAENMPLQRKDGTVFYADISAAEVRLGGEECTVGIFRDISERKQVEETIKVTNTKLRTLIETIPDMIIFKDARGRHLIVNRSAEEVTGHRREDFIGRTAHDLLPPGPAEACRKSDEETMQGKGPAQTEEQVFTTNGRKRFFEILKAPMVDDGDNVIGLVAIGRDITARKQAETELHMREKQLAESQRIAHIGSWEHNLTTGKVFWSDELFRLLGLDPEIDPADFAVFLEMVHPHDQPVLKQAIAETVASGKPFNVDYRFIRKDGSVRVLHAQAELLHDEDTGTQAILSGTGQDITDRKQAEEKMRQSEAFIRSILDTVDEGFIVIDRDFRILTANKAYCEQAGSAPRTCIGRHCYEVSHNSVRPCYERGRGMRSARGFRPEPQTAIHRHNDGKGGMLYVETKAFPIRDASGRSPP